MRMTIFFFFFFFFFFLIITLLPQKQQQIWWCQGWGPDITTLHLYNGQSYHALLTIQAFNYKICKQ